MIQIADRNRRVVAVSVFMAPLMLSAASPAIALCPLGHHENSVSWGGADSDSVHYLITGSNGDVLTAGDFSGIVDFDPGIDTVIHTASGAGDAYLSRFTPDGVLSWTLVVGGNDAESPDAIHSIVEAADQSIIVGGEFGGIVEFDPMGQIPAAASNGLMDAFVASYGPDGDYQWSVTMGGTSTDSLSALAVLSNGDLICVGSFSDKVDFDPGPGVAEAVSVGLSDIFMLLLGPGGEFKWVKTLGSEGDEGVNNVRVFSDDSFVIASRFEGTLDFDPGSRVEEHTSQGLDDAFLSCYSAAGELRWTKVIGGELGDAAQVLAVGHDELFVAGRFSRDVDFDPSEGIDVRTARGYHDVFVSKYSSNGKYLGTFTIGDDGEERSLGLTMAPDGSVFVAGVFGTVGCQPGNYSVDFDPYGAGDVHTSYGDDDIFVTQLGKDLSYGATWTAGGVDNDTGVGVVSTSDGVWVSGEFSDVIDFDPIGEGDARASNGGLDVFLIHLDCLDEVPPDCEGDVNADAVIDPLDSGYILARIGCGVGTGDSDCDAADANLDGEVDPLDVGFVLSRFGACP